MTKKYTLFLFVLSFIFVGFFSFKVNSANAQTGSGGGEGGSSSLPAGCTSTRGYSPTTGIKCDTVIDPSLPAGCVTTQGYSPTTGVKCDTVIGSVIPAGCVSDYGYSVTTGRPCNNGATFPAGCYSNQGFSSTTGEPCSGSTNNPIIESVSGPQSLNINQRGDWSVIAHDRNGGNLSYSIRWGDETSVDNAPNAASAVPRQTATFSHTYSRAGLFTPTFTVRNSVGLSAQTSLSVRVGNATQPSIISLGTNNALPGEKVAMYISNFPSANSYTVTFAGQNISGDTDASLSSNGSYLGFTVPNFPSGSYKLTAQGRSSSGALLFSTQNSISFTIGATSSRPSVTVVSPNGRETLTQGQYSTIQWSTKNIPSDATMNIYVVNSLSSDNSPTGQIAANLNPNEGPFNKQLFIWQSTGTDLNGEILPTGRYKILVEVTYAVPVTADNQKGIVVVKDLSDNYFSITSPATRQPSITNIIPSSGPINTLVTVTGSNFIPTGNELRFACFNGSAAGETNLSSNGTILSTRVPSIAIPVGTVISYPLNCAVTVHNSLGISNSVPFTLTSSSTQPSITVLNPGTSGERLTSGTEYRIRWQYSGNLNNVNIALYGVGSGGTRYLSGGIDIATVLASQGYYDWTVPSKIGTWKIVLTQPANEVQTGQTAAIAESNSYFSIVAPSSTTSSIQYPTSLTAGAINAMTNTSTTSGTKSFYFTQFLEEGSSNNEVTELQKLLSGAGYYSGTIDGKFGLNTKEALIKFQTANGLKSDGIVGFEVRSFLNR